MNNRPGCLSGLLRLFLLTWLFDWLQDNFGFGRGGACGCGCGFLFLLLFVAMACSVVVGTNWIELGF